MPALYKKRKQIVKKMICSLNGSILEWYSVRWYVGASVISNSFLTVLREIPRIDAVARLDFVCLYTFWTAAQSFKSFTF